MIVDDMRATLPKGMAKKYEDRIVHLRALFEQWHSSGRSDRDCNLLLYLMRRAWRPVYAHLRARYIKLWGPKATFSYFFPEHTHNAIWHRATDRIKKERCRA
jgi:hypothetical protein